MKKHLVLGALAVLALAACTKSEVVEINKSNEISLTAVTGKNLTKAADGYCNSSMPNTFDVWAATDGKTYFEAETYTKDGSTNTYKSGTARYWPATKVDFFAAKNYEGTGTTPATATLTATETTKLAVTNFEVTTTVANQKDFLYAVTKDASKPTGGATAVNSFLRHALSQIEFKAKNENTHIHVEISQLTLKNIYSKGNFTAEAATTNNFVDHTFGETADTDDRAGRGTWANWSNPQDYSLSYTTAVDLANGGTADLSVVDPSGKEYNEKTMYLIPQTVNRWDGVASASTPHIPADKAYFELTAKIYNVAGLSVDKAHDVVLHDGLIAVPIPESTTGQDGLRYVYTFNFTSYGTGGVDPGTGDPVLTPITLTVTVDDFVDAGNTDVEVK